MTKIMERIYSAVQNQEDSVLNQIETDVELAREDGLLDSEQYSIKKLSDNKLQLTDKVNNEVTNIDITDDNKLSLSEPVSETEIQDIPLNSQVAWIDESDNIHQGTLKELNGNLVTIKPLSDTEEEVTLNKDQVRLLDSKTYAAKFKDNKMVIRFGEYDIEFDIQSGIAKVLDEKVDCSWKFNKNDKMSMLIKQAQKEIENCNKPKSKKFSKAKEGPWIVHKVSGGTIQLDGWTTTSKSDYDDKVNKAEEAYKSNPNRLTEKALQCLKVVAGTFTDRKDAVAKQKELTKEKHKKFSIAQKEFNNDLGRFIEWHEDPTKISIELMRKIYDIFDKAGCNKDMTVDQCFNKLNNSDRLKVMKLAGLK